MTKQTVGYVELEWECPNCGTRNPGTVKKCSACGFPQPEDVVFQQGAQDVLIADPDKIEQAKLGPDIHCPYCGTRNLAGTERCKQCGGDLEEARRREAGQVIGAFQPDEAPPVVCPACGSENPATAVKCSNCGATLAKPQRPAKPTPKTPAPSAPRWLIPAVLGAILVICLGMVFLQSRTHDTVGEVSGVQWTRRILIQALVPVQREAWQDDLPGNAQVGTCSQELHHVSPDPEPDSVEVCGTPYVVDTGTGVGEVVKDCQYEVYRPRCRYTVLAWVAVAPIVAQGRDYSPQWPATVLGEDQREAGREESYVVLFSSDGDTYRYPVRSADELSRFTPGSRWRLQVNTFGTVQEVEQVE